MPKFKNRRLQIVDLIGRFETRSSAEHTYNALAAVERLKDEGATFWEKGSFQLLRWESGCSILWKFLNTLGRRRLETPDLAEVMREFVQEFEHSTGRMLQMLYGTSDDLDNDPEISRILNWLCLVYRLSTYSLVSYWIDDKTEENTIKIKVNISTGATTEELYAQRNASAQETPTCHQASMTLGLHCEEDSNRLPVTWAVRGTHHR